MCKPMKDVFNNVKFKSSTRPHRVSKAFGIMHKVVLWGLGHGQTMKPPNELRPVVMNTGADPIQINLAL